MTIDTAKCGACSNSGYVQGADGRLIRCTSCMKKWDVMVARLHGPYQEYSLVVEAATAQEAWRWAVREVNSSSEFVFSIKEHVPGVPGRVGRLKTWLRQAFSTIWRGATCRGHRALPWLQG